MRRLKPDVSHRIRRRGPSILGAGWFRLLLGSSMAIILALAVGPSVAGWFGAGFARGVRLLAPWSGTDDSKAPATSPDRQEAPTIAAESSPEAQGSAAGAGAAAAPPPAKEAPAPAAEARSAGPGLTAPPPVFRIQVGAFLDPRNADRLVERLRGEGLGAGTSVFEQSRVLYRVLALPAEGALGAVDEASLVERLRTLGMTADATDEGVAVTGPVTLRAAVETSHRLREHGIPVRLKQEVGSATYRVVRVGPYMSNEEAERALAVLVARGFEGFVVRER